MTRFVQKIRRLSRVLGYVAAGVVVAGGAVIYDRKTRNPVNAPCAINYTPNKWDLNWDRREPGYLIQALMESATDEDKAKYIKEAVTKHPTATRHIILVRHGQYLKGDDVKKNLTELGREQAAFTGARLADLRYPWSKMIVSTHTRAQETADIIHQYLPHLHRENSNWLLEGAPIPPEPLVIHEKPDYYSEGPRIETAFRKYFHRADVDQTKDSYEIMVCPTDVLKYFVCRVLQFPPKGWIRLSIDHASITWITIRPDGLVCILTLGDSGFMPVDKVSTF